MSEARRTAAEPVPAGELSDGVPGAVRVSFGVLTIILAVDLYVFHSMLGGLPLAAVGIAILMAAIVRPQPAWVLAGVLAYAAGTFTLSLLRYDTLRSVLFLAAVGGPLLALLSLAPRLDDDAPPRPEVPAGALLKRFGLQWLLVAAIVATPAFVGPVRAAWAADLGPVLAGFLIAGAGIAVFGPGLVDGDKEPTKAVAERLESGKEVRFAALPWMRTR